MTRKKYNTEEERKEARRESRRKSYYKNKEKELEYKKQYYQEHKEECSKLWKQWYQDNKEKELERAKQYKNTKIGKSIKLIYDYSRSDKEHNRGECTLTPQWMVDNIFTKCHWCPETDWRKLGCDRIDNSKPHTPDNVIPCCTKCNRKRGRKTYEEFLKEMQQKMLEEAEAPL